MKKHLSDKFLKCSNDLIATITEWECTERFCRDLQNLMKCFNE